MNRRRQGFTLIELLVAIGIIIILVGILFIGMRVLEKSGKEGSTRVTLENCRAMLAELELKVKGGASAGTLPAPGVVTEMGETGSPDRSGPAVALTHSKMAAIFSIPVNKSALENLSPQQILSFPSGAFSTPPDWADGTNYETLDRVRYPAGGSGQNYICLNDHVSSDGLPVPPPEDNQPGVPGAPWIRENLTSPVLLDGWNNPIIYVPTSLRIYDPVTDTTLATIAAPDNRPFFASAGPDGMFQAVSDDSDATGRQEAILAGANDNLYSFEN